MRLARKDKLHGTLLVVDDGRQAIQIGEEQQRPFVSGETARKTDLQHIGLDALEHLHDLMGRIHAHLPGIAVAAADQANELLFEHHALLPKVFVRDVVHLLPLRNTIFVPLEPFGKIAGIQTAQAHSRPGREMHAVGHVTDMQFVLEIPRPQISQNLFGDLAVQPRHAVDLLREVAGKHRHREFFVRILRIHATQADKLRPVDAQLLGIVRQILPDHRLRERIVSRRHGRMGRKQRGGANHFQRFGESQSAAHHQVADALQPEKCRMTLVAMGNVLRDMQRLERPHTADTQQNLLFEPVLPIAAVQVMRHPAILLEIGLVIGVEQVQVGTSHPAKPDAGRERTSRQGNRHGRPVAHRIAHGLDRQLREVLCFVSRLLSPLSGEFLSKITVPVQQSDRDHRHVLVGRLLQIVAGQDAQTARIDLQRSMQAVFHREIGDLRCRRIGFFGHVALELRIYRIKRSQERLVPLQLFQPVYGQQIEKSDRITFASVPKVGIDLLEQIPGAGIPAPPKVVGQLLERTEPFGKVLLHHHPVPLRTLRTKRLMHELDLLLGQRRRIRSHMVHPHVGIIERQRVSLFVRLEKPAPERLFRQHARSTTHLLHTSGIQLRKPQHGIGQRRGHFVVVAILAAKYRYAGMLLPPVDPKTESGEGRGDGRHGKGDRLERCIAPGFIIRRKQGQIHAHEQLVIALVENTVPVIQIRRHENHMHFGCRIGQRTAVDRPHDRIPLHILQIMGRPRPLRAVDRLRWILQVLLQVGTGSPVGGRHHDIQHDLPIQAFQPGQPLHTLQQHIQPLIAEFVSAARADDQRIILQLAAQASLRHSDQSRTSLFTFDPIVVVLPNEIVLKTVGRHDIYLVPQQIATFGSRNSAHGQESVAVGRRLLLDRMLGRHAETTGQVVRIVRSQIPIKRHSVSGDAASQHGSVRSEQRGHVRRLPTQIKSSGGGHPLVEMSRDPVCGLTESFDVGSYDQSGGIAEQHRLDVIPLARNRIHTVALPKELQDVVLAGNQRGEIDQNHLRPPDDAPMSYTDTDPLLIQGLPPPLEQRRILLELPVSPLPQIGTDRKIAVAVLSAHGPGLGRYHGIDTAHLIAHFPTDLEEKVGFQFHIVHISMI